MNLFSVAQHGLYSAQTALDVVANNLNNVATADYCKQKVILAEAEGQNTQQGFLGSGVQVAIIQRINDNFLNAIERESHHEQGEVEVCYKYANQIDNLFSTTRKDISDSFSQVFISLQKMNGDTPSSALRQEVLASFSSLLNHFKNYDDTLTSLGQSINSEINQSIDYINKYTQQLAKLNTEINQNYNQSKVLPANLLDRRDALLKKLSSEVAIKVYETPVNGQTRIILKNGLTLVNEGHSYQLEGESGRQRSLQSSLYYKGTGGQQLAIDNRHLLQGKLGGLLRFSQCQLKETSDTLNEIALKVADQFNQANRGGMDFNGQPGIDVFTLSSPGIEACADNRGGVVPQVEYDKISDIKHDLYEIIAPSSDKGEWTVTKGQNQANVKLTSRGDKQFSFDGLTVTIPDTIINGDRYHIHPVSGVIANMQMNMTEMRQLAVGRLASETDNEENHVPQESDNRNLKVFQAIRDRDLTEYGSFLKSYTYMVSQAGNSTADLKEQKKAISNVCSHIEMTKQEYSGVDTTSEYIQMMMMTKYYQANAQILQTATTLFDAILNIH